MRRAIRCRL